MSDVPAGFVALDRPGDYLELFGPLYRSSDPGVRNVIAMRAMKKHLNLRGIVHGGALASLIDTAFGITLWRTADGKISTVTVGLAMDYLEPAKEGDWIEAHVDVLRIGRRLAFVEGLLLVGDRKVLRANGTFAVVEPRK